jgi:hypothetical protein
MKTFTIEEETYYTTVHATAQDAEAVAKHRAVPPTKPGWQGSPLSDRWRS